MEAFADIWGYLQKTGRRFLGAFFFWGSPEPACLSYKSWDDGANGPEHRTSAQGLIYKSQFGVDLVLLPELYHSVSLFGRACTWSKPQIRCASQFLVTEKLSLGMGRPAVSAWLHGCIWSLSKAIGASTSPLEVSACFLYVAYQGWFHAEWQLSIQWFWCESYSNDMWWLATLNCGANAMLRIYWGIPWNTAFWCISLNLCWRCWNIWKGGMSNVVKQNVARTVGRNANRRVANGFLPFDRVSANAFCNEPGGITSLSARWLGAWSSGWDKKNLSSSEAQRQSTQRHKKQQKTKKNFWRCSGDMWRPLTNDGFAEVRRRRSRPVMMRWRPGATRDLTLRCQMM